MSRNGHLVSPVISVAYGTCLATTKLRLKAADRFHPSPIAYLQTVYSSHEALLTTRSMLRWPQEKQSYLCAPLHAWYRHSAKGRDLLPRMGALNFAHLHVQHAEVVLKQYSESSSDTTFHCPVIFSQMQWMGACINNCLQSCKPLHATASQVRCCVGFLRYAYGPGCLRPCLGSSNIHHMLFSALHIKGVLVAPIQRMSKWLLVLV